MAGSTDASQDLGDGFLRAGIHAATEAAVPHSWGATAPHHKAKAQGGAPQDSAPARLPQRGPAARLSINHCCAALKSTGPRMKQLPCFPSLCTPSSQSMAQGPAMASRGPSTAFPCKEAPKEFLVEAGSGTFKGKTKLSGDGRV